MSAIQKSPTTAMLFSALAKAQSQIGVASQG
jgi:hypothetical protein